MSEILQLSFISSKSRHLSALCVSEIMLGSLANNCDREGTKSHGGHLDSHRAPNCAVDFFISDGRS